MKRISWYLLFVFVAIFSVVLIAHASGDGTITQLQQFVATTSPNNAITQSTYGKSIQITGLSDGCLYLSGSVVSSNSGNPTCTGGGGGGSGSGTVSTSTPLVSGQVDFSTGVSTIGNDSSFTFSTALKNLTASYASTTAFTVTGNAYIPKLSNLTTNGFVTTSGAVGTLGVQTFPISVAEGGSGAVSLTGCISGNGTGAFTASGTCNTSNATVSSVATNGTLTGGTITTTGTLGLNLANTNAWTAPATTTYTNGLQASYLALTGTSATSTFANGLNLSAGCFSISGVCIGIGSSGVSSISIASANGFAGSSSGGTTPALTLSTSISGLLKGNGTAISAAIAGTDYVNGSGTSGNCVAWGATNSLTDAGAPCGSGGGSGTVNSGLANQNAFYASNGTAVTGTSTLSDFPNQTVSIGPSGSQPTALLEIGTTTSADKTGGLYFGTDVTADLYRSASQTIKTDGILFAAQGVDTGVVQTSGHTIVLKGDSAASQPINGVIAGEIGVSTFTSGTGQILSTNGTFSPTSGTGVMNFFQPTDTVNQSGSANGITRDIYILPTITKATDYRAFETAPYTFNLNISTTTLMSTLMNPFTIASTTAATVTNAYEQQILGAPVASSNVTISTSSALMINSNDVSNGGTVTNAYGAIIQAPTGATNNYGLSVRGDVQTVGTTTPILSSCGTNPTIRGTDTAGEITVGSVAATGCTAQFATSKAFAPSCTITEQTGSVTNAFGYTISTTGFVITQVGLTGDKLDYQCIQLNQ